jgi:hypothetical protein
MAYSVYPDRPMQAMPATMKAALVRTMVKPPDAILGGAGITVPYACRAPGVTAA